MKKDQNKKRYTCRLGLLSKYRNECMGLAILFVIFVHSVDFGINYPKKIANFSYLGQVGVYIFFMVSGIGMYYSLSKSDQGFYKRRFKKIMPSYFMIALPVFAVIDLIMDHDNFGSFLLDISMLRWWLFGRGYCCTACTLCIDSISS